MAKWSDALNIVAKAAPTIGSIAGGPLAGAAISALEHAFGIDPAGDLTKRQDALASAVTGATTEQLLALKKADNDFKAQMAELGYKDDEAIAALGAQDRDSARKREMTVRDRTPQILAYIVVALAAAGEGFIIFYGTPKGVDPVILGRVLGTLDAALMLVLSYYFGASSTDHNKTNLPEADKK